MKSSSIKLIQVGIVAIAIFAVPHFTHAQTTLYATSPGRSYEEIDSTLGLNSGAMEETPDQCSNHPQFGRHILEVWDTTLQKYVYEFYIHIKSHLDNDRCINFDRQRSEIKTDASSPTYLKGFVGNQLTFTWMFKLPKNFQAGPLFTHIHQIKAVNGDYSSPLFTLSPYVSGKKREMQIVYVKDSATSQVVEKYSALDSCLGIWVRATENITVGATGTYTIVLNRVSDGKQLLSYSNNNIETIRPSNSFIRPKWGLYRSVVDSIDLRDDTLRLTDVYLFNNQIPTAPSTLSSKGVTASTVSLAWKETVNNLSIFEVERSLDGIIWDSVASVRVGTVAFLDTGLNQNTTYYYRVKAENPAGSSAYTNVIKVTTAKNLPVDLVSFDVGFVGNNIELGWAVANEINFSKYELQISTDGISFTNFATITADGRSSYSYLQTKNIKSKNYYRLKLINKDGSFCYSKTVLLTGALKGSVSIYPNPAKDYITVVSTNISANSRILILDALGRKVTEETSSINSTSTVRISVKGLSKGSYFLRLMDENEVCETYPFIISR